jgi:diadenylate cyclase
VILQYLGVLGQLRLVDVLDILAVSVVMYRFLLIIQGTRSMQMLFGMMSLGAIWWISSSYEFYSLSWLLQHFFDYIFIILIVLFQEQIRSVLVAISGAKFFKNADKSSVDQQIEEVVSACFSLAREKTGALIVFERNHGLLNYSLTGTRLDSRVHSDVLYSLFQLKSPLHDGAIFIYNGLIQSAGCFLPLSKNVDIDREFGTRHRAAMGITEITDAVVVVVSEETGKVKLCVAGKFTNQENGDVLRQNLRRYLLDLSTRPELNSLLSSN